MTRLRHLNFAARQERKSWRVILAVGILGWGLDLKSIGHWPAANELCPHLGLSTRYAIAKSVAKQIPIFAPLMPPARKIWNGENRRMGLFDTTALAPAFIRLSRG
jgi:hypothetical protein